MLESLLFYRKDELEDEDAMSDDEGDVRNLM